LQKFLQEKKGEFVELQDTIKGFRDIVSGKYDHLPEQAFYMVGDISMVVKKAEEIAIEVARIKAQRGEVDEPTQKKGAKKQAVVAKKIKETADLLPIPKPPQSSDYIREKLKKIADECKVSDLKLAAEYKKDQVEGEIGVGWNFPKEEKIHQIYADWNKMYEEQVDLEKVFSDHFEDLKKRHAEQEAKERAELSS